MQVIISGFKHNKVYSIPITYSKRYEEYNIIKVMYHGYILDILILFFYKTYNTKMVLYIYKKKVAIFFSPPSAILSQKFSYTKERLWRFHCWTCSHYSRDYVLLYYVCCVYCHFVVDMKNKCLSKCEFCCFTCYIFYSGNYKETKEWQDNKNLLYIQSKCS